MKAKFLLTTIITISLLFILNGLALASWGFQTSNTRLDTDASNNASTYPKVCSDNSGHVYVVWIDGRGGIYFNRSDDYGQNWLSNDVLVTSVSNPASLKIGCDNTNHVYVMWLQGASVMLARSDNNGQNWSTGGIAGPVSEGYDFAYNQNGHLVVVWNTDNNYDLFANYSTNYGATWSQKKKVVTLPHYNGDFHKTPQVAIDNNGHVYVVWLDDRGLTPLEHITYFNRSNNYGQNWQNEFPISDNQYGIVNKDPKITCDNSGNVYVAWLKTVYQQPNVLYFNRSGNYGQNWFGSQSIDWYLDKHQLEVADNGNMYLAWNDTRSQWTKIKFKSSFDYGVTWQPTVMVTNEPHNCQLGNFDFATKGNSVYLVWENLEPWQGTFFNFSKDGGVSWQNRNGRVDNNSDETSIATNRPAISVDADENIFVAWEDGRNGANTDIYFNRGDYILDLNEKIKLEADYLVACQYLNPGDIAHGAINDVHTPTTPPDYVVPRENGMAILGLLKAYEVLGDTTYLQRANLSMDYLVRVQEADGSWRDEYDYRTPPGSLSKSPTQPAEVMMAMYILGYRDDRYPSMKLAAQYLFECQNHGYQQKLICGGKDADGNLSDWNWITDNSYAYWALLSARGWALVKGETSFAQDCNDAAMDILFGINSYFKNTSDVWWWQVVDNWGNSFNNGDIIDWLNYTPRFLDLPVNGVNNPDLGEWIHTTFQVPSGNDGCLWGDRYPNQEYPGMSFQAAFSWFDLGQNDYANAAISWAENSALWQLIPDENGILGGWVDWINVNDPTVRAGAWERYVDTSFYSIGSWLGGYDFTVFNNEPPVLSLIGNKGIYLGQTLTFQVSATDPDGQELKFSASNLPGGATFDPESQIFQWNPTSSQVGQYSNIEFQVSDGFLIDSENITITVRRPSGGCFLAGTPILMADGSTKSIEEIKVSDTVLAYDVVSGKKLKDRVSAVFVHDGDSYLIINDELKVTPNHPVYSQGKWVEIGSLKVGDKLLNQKGKYQQINSIKKIEAAVNVYNFEVNPYHTYFAGGYLAHNKMPCKIPVD